MEAQYEPIIPASIEQSPETQAGVLSRIRGMAVNAWETASRHPKELLAISAASFACAQAAELSLEAAPVAADAGNVPTATALKQECVQAGLVRPTVIYAKMAYPGNKYQQNVSTSVSFEDMPIDCRGEYDRRSSIRFELQNYKNHKQWFTMNVPKWYPLAGNAGGAVGPSIQPTGHEGSWIYYHPTPGPGRTHVRELIRNTVTDSNGKIVAQKVIATVPVKVEAPIRKQ